MVGDADLMQETVVKSGRAVSNFTTGGDDVHQIGLGTNERAERIKRFLRGRT
jgi:hypothetical protein